jgi:hypothetical protein
MLSIEKVVCDLLRTMSGSTMSTVALMDTLQGKDLMSAFGYIPTYVGAVVLTMYGSRFST